jgi:hypothetical protein
VFVTSLLGEIGARHETATSAAAAGIIGMVKALTLDVSTVRFSIVATTWPSPGEHWQAADVDSWASSSPWDHAAVGRAAASAAMFLANDEEGHLRGQDIRIPSDVTT